jgi:hypothetical protein
MQTPKRIEQDQEEAPIDEEEAQDEENSEPPVFEQSPAQERFFLEDKKNGIRLEAHSSYIKCDYLSALCLSVRSQLMQEDNEKKNGGSYLG